MMEVDPEFEFECPKWINFQDEDQETAAQFTEGFDDSWFEKEHPLHEPKDKDKNELELRPLIDIQEQTIKSGRRKTSTTTKSGKWKSSINSLNIKKSVTLQRREKRRILPEITNEIDNKNVNGDGPFNRHHRDFTPPAADYSPYTTDKKGNSCSPLSALMSSPLRGDGTITANSLKQSLLAKAATNLDGQRKRRRLPTIPSEVQSIQGSSSLLPQRALSASDETGQLKTKTVEFSPRRLDKQPKKISNQNQQKCIRNTTELDTDLNVENLLKLHNQKVMASKCKYDINGRRVRDDNPTTARPTGSDVCLIKCTKSTNKLESHKEENVKCVDKQKNNADYKIRDQFEDNDHQQNKSTTKENLNSTHVCDNQVKIQNETEMSGTNSVKPVTAKKETSRIESSERNIESEGCIEVTEFREDKEKSKELSIEELLKQHNKKVVASKCKYDSNGRRIQPANPVFCPAPGQTGTSNKVNAEQLSSPNECNRPNSRMKRSISNVEVPSSQHNKRRSTTEAPDKEAPLLTSQREKRRSCAVTTNRKSLNQSNITKYKSYNADPVTSRDIDKQYSLMSSACDAGNGEIKVMKKTKRRSCVAAPVTRTKTDKLGEQHKRRSCFTVSSSKDDIVKDEELKNLIAKHNNRLAKLT